MVNEPGLESLYREAKSALKVKDYDRASELLRQILLIDENYRDASRLLAQAVKLKRRRRYNHPLLWGTLGLVIVVALGFLITSRMKDFAVDPPTQAVATKSPAVTLAPTMSVSPTESLLPTATPIPLTWKRISLGQEFERDRITAFEIDLKDPDVLYIRMENAGFYQSIDGGISWRPIQITDTPPDIAAKLSINKNHNRDGEYTVANTAPDGKTRLYQRSWYGADWQVSEDNGRSWSKFGIVGSPPSGAITFDSEGSFYAYCISYLCKYSADGKQTIKLGKPHVGAFTIIVLSPFDPNTIYVAGQGLAFSRDGGLTWTKLNNGLGNVLLTLDTAKGNPPTLYLQMDKCNVQDQSWTHPKEPWAEAGQRLYTSANGGQTWELALQGGCSLVKDADGETFYRIGQSIEWIIGTNDGKVGIWRSQNGGESWEKVFVPDIENAIASTLTADLTQSGLIYLYIPVSDPKSESWPFYELVSEDYGHNWSELNPSKEPKPCYGSTLQFMDAYHPMAIDPFDGNHVFVVDSGTLLESHDSCETTSAFATAPNRSINSIAFDSQTPNTLYAGTEEGAYVSFDGGQTWHQINDGLLGATIVYSVVADKDGNVYAATPYGIFKLEGK